MLGDSLPQPVLSGNHGSRHLAPDNLLKTSSILGCEALWIWSGLASIEINEILANPMQNVGKSPNKVACVENATFQIKSVVG